MQKVRGFTLIELLVVMVIIGILVALALPNYMKAKDKARESQVSSNIHVIQIAIERYAVDNDGNYPKWLFGGDFSDWDTVQFVSPVYCPGANVNAYANPLSPPCGDGDALLEYGYLSAYPRNPFMRGVGNGRNLHVLSCPNPTYSNGDPNGLPGNGFCDYGTANNGLGYLGQSSGANSCQASTTARPSCRKVGGISNTLMWDVSEGVYGSIGHAEGGYAAFRGSSVIRVRGWAGHPPWPILCQRGAAGCLTGEAATANRKIAPWLVGNFYYYPLMQDIKLAFVVGATNPMVGYNLAGYGAIWNAGHDVYDAMGDYEDGMLYCDYDPYGNCVIDITDVAYVNEGAGGPHRRLYCVTDGPDGQKDGVIVVVTSGKDRKPLMDKSRAGCGQ